MSTPSTTISTAEAAAPCRTPLRLRMADHPGRNQLDGGWWPQSRDLTVELADLVDHFPTELGHIARVVYSPPDWESAPRRIPVRRGYIKAGSFPRDDTHLILLSMSDRSILHVLVVPPSYSDAQGDEALLAAATRGNLHTAPALLDAVTDNHDVDPGDQWNDDGGNWWGDCSGGPSFRRQAHTPA